MGREYDLLGALVLALSIYAIWMVLHEPGASGKRKVIWIVLILFLPLLGSLLYLLVFRKKA